VVTPSSNPNKNPGCTIEVPVTTTAYYLEPTIHSSATVSPDKNTIYTMNPDLASDSVQERNLTVTAEDSTQKTYTITVKRALSADATLKSISLTDVTDGNNSPISGYSPITIRPGNVSYNVTVTGDVEEILISVEKNDSKATVTTDLTQTVSLSYGINRVPINLVAENGTTTGSYVLNITRNKKIDATLKDLQVNSATVTNFVGTNTGYTYPANGANLSYNTTSLNILAHVNDDKSSDAIENAIIQNVVVRYNDEATPHNVTITPSEEVTASVPLSTGKNVIEIEVAAQDRTQTKKYTITVNRAKNTDTSIQKVEVYYDGTYHEATLETSGIYTITVPNDVTRVFKEGSTPTSGAVKVIPASGATSDDPVAMW
ncbi:MAG: cadherin-like beta sandwich domain-containing protein, partial [Clostridia bacterium]|nr:cadherin-like beta sandwich domain-containing protein [Clostridia bacterium]